MILNSRLGIYVFFLHLQNVDITFELSRPSTFQEGIVFKCNTEVGRDVSLGMELSSGLCWCNNIRTSWQVVIECQALKSGEMKVLQCCL